MTLTDTEMQDLGRLAARWLAPYLREELGAQVPEDEKPRQELRSYTAETCEEYVRGLGEKVLGTAATFFGRLAEKGEVDSLALAEALGVGTPRNIPAVLTTPLKRRARALALAYPWEQNDEGERTVWIDRDRIAKRMVAAIDAERARRERRR